MPRADHDRFYRFCGLDRLALALSVALLAACQTTPRLVGQDTQVLTSGRLSSLNPADVVVSPVEVAVEGLRVPEEDLRVGAQRALVVRRYSPLALERVDEKLVEASYSPGTLKEDAILRLIVHGWDDTLWEGRRALTVDIEARLIDPSDPYGQPLWAGQLPRRFDFTSLDPLSASERGLMGAACDKIMRELLAALPARVPEPGPQQ